MLAVLLIGGIGLLLGGLLAVVIGIPVKEFSFGNTMILAGAIIACTGVLMIAIWIAVRELKRVVRQLAPGTTATTDETNIPGLGASSAGTPMPEDGGFLFGGDRSAATATNAERRAQSETVPHASWLEQTAPRDPGDARNRESEEPNPSAKSRRNLMFASSRRDRERAQGRTSESPLGDFSPGSPLTSPQEPAREDATNAPAQSEDVWATRGRGRSNEPPPQRRSSALPSPPQPAGGSGDQPPVTVLKSGVVDGMAYSLFSDGSIEAQMPEGLMRFASIDELRAHLDQRP
jgi:hypothetical protein